MSHIADVFISYSREDRVRVLSLASELRNAGISLWIDEGSIDGATMWGEEIVNALENAKVLLLMVTERSVNSHNVVKEVVLASERKSHILPIHLEPTHIPPTLKYPLAGIQHIEYFTADSKDSLKSILRSLERLNVTVQKPPPPAAAGAPPEASPQIPFPDIDFESFGNAIAVLPFDNMSPDKDSDYFSDGLADELITNLSKITELQVISRLLSMQYKGVKKDLRTIGAELKARYLVAGGVRKIGDNLRISAQFIDVASNRELWAEKYKGTLDEIFDIQEEVAKQIAEALKLKLSIQEKVTLMKRPTENAEAYDLYLRGKEYLYQLQRKSVEYSIQLFEKAIELDSRYAAAYGACSYAYCLLYSLFKRDERLKELAQELGFKALMYDNNSADAYAALALSYYYRSMYEEAISAGKRAIELNPDNFLPYWLIGRVYFSMGMYEEARELLERSLEMEANFYTTYSDLELTYNALGRTAEGVTMRGRMMDFLPTYLLKYPDDGRARIFFAGALAAAGMNEKATIEAKRAMELSPDDPLMLYNIACVFSLLGEKALAVESLKNAFKAGYEYADWIERDSDLDPIRNEPGYIELMKGRSSSGS